jgi:ferredoxin-NADP reductase
MKQELVKQLDGYDAVVKEIETARKYGSDYTLERGMVEAYLSKIHPPVLNLMVNDIITETPTTKTLRLISENRYLPPFQAGQYIALFVDVGGIRTSRPYSISSQPNQVGYYDITIRRVEDGLVSAYLLDQIKIGDRLESSAPAGGFHFNPIIHHKEIACIAGGSGITPFMSMIREITECGLDRTIYLFYGNKTLDDVIFHEELSRISARFDNIHYVPVIETPSAEYSGRTGYITADLIKSVIADTGGASFFVCGPQAMYDFCLPEVETLGVRQRRIRREMYGPPVNIWEYPGWPEAVRADDQFSIKIRGKSAVQARAGESLLTSLEKNHVLIPSLCRSGECSMCRVKVLKGKVFQPAGVPVRASDTQFGYVHSCVSYPLEDLEIII